MSGLVAVLERRGPADVERAGRMLARLAHRGPDGLDLWAEGPFALGLARLATTPEEPARARVAREGKLVAVGDLRIDNRPELEARLGALGCERRGASDLELLVALVARLGDDAFAHVVGDFACALVDLERGALLVARDSLGVKPLFVLERADLVLAASEPRALFADARLSVELEPLALAESVAGLYEERSETLFRGVEPHPIGTLAVFSLASGRRRRFHAWDIERDDAARDDHERASHLRAALTTAVRARLRARGGVSAHVSGGLDSSTVAALASRVAGEAGAGSELTLLHLSFSGLSCDEGAFARDVARHLRRPLVEVEAPRAPAWRFAELDVGSARSRFEPTGAALDQALAKSRGLGASVVLSGWGGDELFDFKGHEVSEALRDGRLGEALSVVLQRREGARPTLSLSGARQLVMMGLRPLLPEGLRAPLRRLVGGARARRGAASRRYPFLSAPLARQVDARREARLSTLREQRRAPPARRAIAAYLEGHGDLLVSLRDIDFTAAAQGVEYRHPFYDRRVVELALSFPHRARARVHQSKLVLRDAMRGLLPSRVLERVDKAEFSSYWAEASAPLFRALSGRIASGRLASRGIIDAAYVERALSRSPPLGSEHEHLGFLSEVLSLELWLTYHDARGHDGSF